MVYKIAIFQFFVFLIFFTLERAYPARQLVRANGFASFWVGINIFALVWVKVIWVAWGLVLINRGNTNSIGIIEHGVMFYLVYSFFNYWIHRLKHQNSFLWKYIHKFHHSPTKMETMVAFYKHPLEIIINTCCILALSLPFATPLEAIAFALAIEGCLEVFHHSNIRTPKRIRWIGYIIQIPEMHLVHHQYGLHKYNYVAFLWDFVFGTAKIPSEWNGRQGFSTSSDVKKHFLLKTG